MKNCKFIEIPVSEYDIEVLRDVANGTREPIEWSFETNDDCIILVKFIQEDWEE